MTALKDYTVEYEVITIGNGKNTHKFVETLLSDNTYEDTRFLKPRSFMDKLRRRFRFVVVYRNDKSMPVTLTGGGKVTSELLYTVATSSTLRNALADLFRKPFKLGFGGKKIIFAIIIIAVAVVGYLVYSGQLNLGSIIKL